jgi:hypothetical protein
MITSPYNLNLETENPTLFYDDLSVYTQNVIEIGYNKCESILTDYVQFIELKQLKRRTDSELLMELLMSGIFWKNYHKNLSTDAIFYRPVFNQLYALRKKYSSIKSRVDSFRGKLAFNILAKEYNKKISLYQRFEYLISWLDCTKEYNQEIERLETWKLFLENKHVDYHTSFWSTIEEFASWFETESELHLGKYTKNWNDFMMDTALDYKNKENYFFCIKLNCLPRWLSVLLLLLFPLTIVIGLMNINFVGMPIGIVSVGIGISGLLQNGVRPWPISSA